jgi:phage I-like protein
MKAIILAALIEALEKQKPVTRTIVEHLGEAALMCLPRARALQQKLDEAVGEIAQLSGELDREAAKQLAGDVDYLEGLQEDNRELRAQVSRLRARVAELETQSLTLPNLNFDWNKETQG